MTNFNNIDYDQIIDYLGENLDTGQKKAFEQWLNESELNQQLFEKIKVHWMNQIPGDTISRSMQWERLLYTIKNRQKSNFRKMAIAISVAASILILVSLSWFINISRNNMVSFSTKADSFRKDTLDDGSIVYLYPSSSIEMEQKKMKITLKGEAYFVISPHVLTSFTVNAGGVSIIVKGTSFLVNTKAKGGDISVQVESGKVELRDIQKSIAPLLVQAGEQAYYSSQKNSSWKTPKEESIYLIYQPNQIIYKLEDNYYP